MLLSFSAFTVGLVAVERRHLRIYEHEAEYALCGLGLLLMADAGYDPEAAVTLYRSAQRMRDRAVLDISTRLFSPIFGPDSGISMAIIFKLLTVSFRSSLVFYIWTFLPISQIR